MKPRKDAALNIPISLYDRLRTHARERGVTIVSIGIAAVARYLDEHAPPRTLGAHEGRST